jgi:hypothetical protein
MNNKYKIYVSDKPDKKYYAIVKGFNKKYYFGSTKHQHYFDKLGYYSYLNHLDKKRKINYYKRHKINYKFPSSDWFSKKYLW